MQYKASYIPVEITLAQGFLESGGASSKVAVNNLNHFGEKCFKKTCKSTHCSNFTDDTHKDFFKIYGSVEDSYHAHFSFLKKKSFLLFPKFPEFLIFLEN